jgi:cytoskeletal protein CcmA (bactofilin family)
MVWKKSEDHPSHPEPSAAPRPAPAPPSTPAAETRRTDRATIGPSIFIKGDLTGDEDLIIEGKVEGKVDLKQNNLTVGKSGRVRADIFGRVVTVEGEVDGNVFAQEAAVLRQSGALRGNISSPRVTLEDGSRFKGSIDMEPKDAARGQQQGGQNQQNQDKREQREREQKEQREQGQNAAPAGAGKVPAA